MCKLRPGVWKGNKHQHWHQHGERSSSHFVQKKKEKSGLTHENPKISSPVAIQLFYISWPEFDLSLVLFSILLYYLLFLLPKPILWDIFPVFITIISQTEPPVALLIASPFPSATTCHSVHDTETDTCIYYTLSRWFLQAKREQCAFGPEEQTSKWVNCQEKREKGKTWKQP